MDFMVKQAIYKAQMYNKALFLKHAFNSKLPKLPKVTQNLIDDSKKVPPISRLANPWTVGAAGVGSLAGLAYLTRYI